MADPRTPPWSDADLARLAALRSGGAKKGELRAAFPDRKEGAIYAALRRMAEVPSVKSKVPAKEQPATKRLPCLGPCGRMRNGTANNRICAPCTRLIAQSTGLDMPITGARLRDR